VKRGQEGGENRENLAKTTEMCFPEKQRSTKGKSGR
jgi:hypothetical protein